MAAVLFLNSVRQSTFALALLVGLLVIVGCGGEESTTPGTPTESTETPSDEKTASSKADVVDSLAETHPNELKTYEAGSTGVSRASSPSEVCDAFVRSLHERNIMAAERLLTLTSRVTIHDQGLELDAIAGENAQYVIGDAKYATQLKQLAYVDCHVTERSQEGEVNFVVRWMLKPEAGYGWRVFGMVMNEDGQNRMINFENSEHAEVVSDIYVANQQTSGPEVRQANENQATLK